MAGSFNGAMTEENRFDIEGSSGLGAVCLRPCKAHPRAPRTDPSQQSCRIAVSIRTGTMIEPVRIMLSDVVSAFGLDGFHRY